RSAWHQLRNFDARARPFAFAAGNIHAKIRAVKHAQAFVNVTDPDPVLKHLRHALLGNSDAVVFDGNDQAAVLRCGANGEFAAAKFGGQAVLQRVFDNRLQEHAGNEGGERVFVNLFVNHESVAPEPRDFNIQVVVDKIEFLLQGHKRFVLL